VVEQGTNDKMNELAESLVHEIELLVERANKYCADIMQANEDKFAENTQVARGMIDKLYQDITQRCIKT
jgi:polyhydroxyalkanoate synthesis regulator phasin